MNQFKFYFSIPFILLFTLNLSVFAQNDSQVSAKLIFPVEQMAKQNSYEILIKIEIEDLWHINSNQPLEDFLIGTEISFESVEGLTFGKIQFPEPELKTFAFSEGEMSVYEGTIYALSTVTVSPNVELEQINIIGYVYYQACDDQSCLPPFELTIEENIPIVEAGEEVTKTNQSLFNKVLPLFQKEETTKVEKEKSIADVISESGMIYAYIFIFLTDY